jgi:hypothetical protein
MRSAHSQNALSGVQRIGLFSFDRGRALWNNDGDGGALYDTQGAVVDEYCY